MTTELTGLGLGILSLSPTHSSTWRDSIATLNWNRTNLASVLNKLVQITVNLRSICFLLPLPGRFQAQVQLGPCRLTRSEHPHHWHPTYWSTNIHAAQSLQHNPPLLPTVPSPSLVCLPSDSPFLQLTAHGRGILKAPNGFIEGWKRA